MNDDFCEEIAVELRLGRLVPPGELNRQFKTAGFKLYYDVYAMPRPDPSPHPKWQSEHSVDVELSVGTEEVDAQEFCDTIRLAYPLATIDSSLIDHFLETVAEVRSRLGGELWRDGEKITLSELSECLTDAVSKLLTEWGEEPGSKDLRVMIMNSYPR